MSTPVLNHPRDAAIQGATQDEHKKLEEFLKATRKGFVAPREGAIKKDSDMATEDSSICSACKPLPAKLHSFKTRFARSCEASFSP